MKREFCASVFVVNPVDKKILLCFHKDFQKWVQPGGHIDKDELPEETAIREAYEETGIRIKLIGERFPREDDFLRPLAIQKNRSSEVIHVDITYVGVPLNQDVVKIDDEILKYRWFTREELDEYDVFQDIKISYDYIVKNIIK